MSAEKSHENSVLSQNKMLFWMCFIALVTTAFSFASRGMVIGQIQLEFGLTETQKGWLLGAGMWPFAIGIVSFSLIVDKIGYKTGLFSALFCHLVSTVMILFGPTFWWLFFGTLLVAVGNGITEAVINPAVAAIFPKAKTKWLNILHAGWAGGILLGALIALSMGSGGIISQFFNNPIGWRWKVGVILLPAVIYGFMLIRAKFPVSERIMAGISYKEMLKEMGIVGFFFVILLVSKEIMNICANIGFAFVGWSDPAMLGVALIVTVVVLIPLGLYIRSWGRGLFILLILLMFPLATTELATDAWIKELMTPVMTMNFGIDGGWVLVFSSLVMMFLRFNCGPIVKRFGPLGILTISSFCAALGLAFIGNVPGIWIIVAATFYAIGQTFFWPTTLGIAAERFPKGGALTLNSISAIGMLGVGILGTPLMGLLQDKHIDEQLMQKNQVVHERVITLEKQSIYGSYQALDPSTLDVLEPEEQSFIENIRNDAKRYALSFVAIIPFIMGLCYLGLLIYFKRKGGYRSVQICAPPGGMEA